MDYYLDYESLKKVFIIAIENYIEIQKSLPAFENGHISIWGKKKDIIAVKIDNGRWKVVITNCKNPQKMKEEIESLQEEDLQFFFETLGYKLPKRNGYWTGLPGFSTWIPDDDYIPEKFNVKKLTWKDIKKLYNFKGIDFKNGFPDFSSVCFLKIFIDKFSKKRYGSKGNIDRANEIGAFKYEKSKKEFVEIIKQHGYTWHECEDCRTLQLVPAILHGNISHKGGVSIILRKMEK